VHMFLFKILIFTTIFNSEEAVLVIGKLVGISCNKLK